MKAIKTVFKCLRFSLALLFFSGAALAGGSGSDTGTGSGNTQDAACFIAKVDAKDKASSAGGSSVHLGDCSCSNDGTQSGTAWSCRVPVTWFGN